MGRRKPLEVNVSLQRAPSPKGACAPGLVRKYKVKYLISPTSTPTQEEKKREKKQNNNDPLPQGGWMEMVTINQVAHFNPMGRASTSPEQEACVIHRCSPGRRELGLAKCGPKASCHSLLRLPQLMAIPGLRLKPTNSASLGVRWRDLSSVAHGSRGPLL